MHNNYPLLKTNLVTFFLLITINLFGQFNGKPQYQVVTHRAGAYLGTFNIELFPLIAPLHTRNFDSLVSAQFFDSTAFHRVVPGFVIQGGDPNSISGPISTWGQGQPWQPTVNAEFSVVRHERGRLGAARDVDTNSANSQFYICVAPALFLDGQYTVYGQVTNGMAVVDTIVSSPRDPNDVPLQKIEMFVTYTGIDSTVPPPPTLIAPANNAVGVLNTQSFQWSALTGAALYSVEFSTDSLFSNVVLAANVGTNSQTFPQLPGSQIYWWRVKTNNGGKLSAYSNIFKFSTAAAAPVLISPADSAVNVVTNPVFTWSVAPLATDYTLQVSIGSVFSLANMIYNQGGLTTTSQQVGGLNNNFRYYWRVRSASNGAQGYYSSKYTFLTATSTGINEQSTSELVIKSIFPNPAQEKLNVTINVASLTDGVVLITDIAGKIFSEEKLSLNAGENHLVFDIKTLSAGNYLLVFTGKGLDVQQKFSVE